MVVVVLLCLRRDSGSPSRCEQRAAEQQQDSSKTRRQVQQRQRAQPDAVELQTRDNTDVVACGIRVLAKVLKIISLRIHDCLLSIRVVGATGGIGREGGFVAAG